MSEQDLPDNWKKSDKSIRAIQVAFEFGTAISDCIRKEANNNGLSTSDQIRKIIKLDVKPAKRPRLTVSLTTVDYQKLAQRYQIDIDNRAAIRAAMRSELIEFSKQNSVQ